MPGALPLERYIDRRSPLERAIPRRASLVWPLPCELPCTHTNMARVWFYNIPFHGHVNPTLPLIREMVARGDHR